MSKIKSQRINLGLAVSALSLEPGETRSLREIADFCDCKWTNIQQIEAKALRKVRAALYRDKDLASELNLVIRK